MLLHLPAALRGRARRVPELFLLLCGEPVENLLQGGLAEGVLPDAESLAFVLHACCWVSQSISQDKQDTEHK